MRPRWVDNTMTGGSNVLAILLELVTESAESNDEVGAGVAKGERTRPLALWDERHVGDGRAEALREKRVRGLEIDRGSWYSARG